MAYSSLFVEDANGTTRELVPAGWLHADPDPVRACNHVEGHRWCNNPNGTWTPLYKIVGRDNSE